MCGAQWIDFEACISWCEATQTVNSILMVVAILSPCTMVALTWNDNGIGLNWEPPRLAAVGGGFSSGLVGFGRVMGF